MKGSVDLFAPCLSRKDRSAINTRWSKKRRLSTAIDIRAQIFQSGIDHERDDCLAWSELLRDLNRGDDICSGGRAGKEGFLARQAPRHRLRVIRANRQDAVHETAVPKGRNVANADAFDVVRPRLTSQQDR
jgi:hypothetical protein